MKRFLFVMLVSVLTLSVYGQSYRLNDTLYLWEMHGADVFLQPGTSEKSLGKYYYGSPVRVVDTEIGKHQVSQEVNEGFNLQGHWVKVIIQKDTGYMFDGYLSSLMPFDLRSDAKGIALTRQNFHVEGAVSKGIRAFESGNLNEGESRDIGFDNGIQWNMKNIQSCLIESYTYPHARLSEAYELMMAVYSNYFDQKATFMAEPEFLKMNGNKFEFILRSESDSNRITLYKSGQDYTISSYTCPDKVR